MSELTGYKGRSLQILKEAGVEIGDFIRVKKGEKVFEGILMPRTGDDRHIVIKLDSGYCIGINIYPEVKIEKIGKGEKPSFTSPPIPKSASNLPKVSIISTGGTIAARVEYRTGAVHPALSAEDLYALFPELSDIAFIQSEVLFSIFSENMTPRHWKSIAECVEKHIRGGSSGVVITHGTDTMAYTAAALSFALQNLPVPVILVGAQRSSDRPSSDAWMDLIGAVTMAAHAPLAEVGIVMHATISDDCLYFHRGTRVRKFHTSRRDTFKSIGIGPLAKLENGKIEMLTDDYRKRDEGRRIVLKPEFEERVALIKFYPGLNPSVIRWYVDQGYLGIILEGTGFGHVGEYCFDAIKYAIDHGLFVGMTSQTLYGRVNMKVYDTGRDLLSMGVTPLEDMLPETALVKLMWAYGQTKELEEVKRLMLTNIAGEITCRSLPNPSFLQ